MKRLAAIVFSGFMISCSMDPVGEHSRLYFSLEDAPGASKAKNDLYQRFSSLANGDIGALTAPSNVDGFSCLAINVMGEGIPAIDNHSGDPNTILANLLAGTSYCAYPGVIAGPLTPANPSVTLTVPSGSNRLIQVIGVQDLSGTACSTIAQPSNGSSSSSSEVIYEVGRTVLDLYGDKAVTVGNEFDTLSAVDKESRKVNCGGGACSAYQYSTSTDTMTSLTLNTNPHYFVVPFQATNAMKISELRMHVDATMTGTTGIAVGVSIRTGVDTSVGGVTNIGTSVVTGTGTAITAIGTQVVVGTLSDYTLTPGTTYWLAFQFSSGGGSISVKAPYATSGGPGCHAFDNAFTWASSATCNPNFTYVGCGVN